jgi:hypothetical protein
MRLLTLTIISFLLIPGLAVADDTQYIQALISIGGNVTIPAGTFTISSSIDVNSNTFVSGTVSNGERLTEIKLIDHAGWDTFVPMFKIATAKNVDICNVIIDGNRDKNLDVGNGGKAWGHGFYNMIHAIDSDNIRVYNCVLRNGLGDGFRTKYSTNIKFYNNECYNLGHDAFYGVDSQNIECFGNKIETETDDGLRMWNSEHVRFHDNTITAGEKPDGLSGNAGVQIEFSKAIENADVEVCNNILYKTWGSGFWLIAYSEGSGLNHGVSIHHNLVYLSPTTHSIPYAAGITIYGENGIDIHNNVFDGAKNSAISNQVGGSNVAIRDNIITNTKEIEIGQAGNGYGIADRVGSNLKIENNCFYNNMNGNLYRCVSSGDDIADPKTHQTTSGWWWTGETWACKFVDPLPLGHIAPTNTTGSVDNDTHEAKDVIDLMNMQFTNSSTVIQDMIYPKREWMAKGKFTQAWIDVPAYENTVSIDHELYVNGRPEDSAIVMGDAKNLAEHPDGINVTKNVTYDGDNLTVKFTVKTKYKEKTAKKTTILGKQFNSTDYKKKSEIITFNKTFAAPEPYPNITASNFTVKVTCYNNTFNPHTVVEIEPKYENDSKFVSEVHVKEKGATAVYYNLIGHVKRLGNGAKITSFENVYSWKSSDDSMGPRYNGVYIDGKFDSATFETRIKTPYDEFTVPYTYSEVNDFTNGLNYAAHVVILIVLFLILRPVLEDLYEKGGRLR